MELKFIENKILWQKQWVTFVKTVSEFTHLNAILELSIVPLSGAALAVASRVGAFFDPDRPLE